MLSRSIGNISDRKVNKLNTWKTVKVGELGKIVTGKTPKTSISENYGGSIPFLTPSDDMSVKYVDKPIKTLTERGLSEVKNAILPPNTVCVSCIGSDLGKVVITTQNTVTNQQINSIIVDTTQFDVSFVYYAMLVLGKELNFISKTSTAVPIVNKSSFSSYEIKCPTLEQQKKISSILSAMDSKIECNQKINYNLYAQARAIANQWITENDRDYELLPLSEVATINPDTYSPKQEWEYVNYLDTSSITDGCIAEIQRITPSTEKLPSRARRKIVSNDVVFSTVRPNQRHFGIISEPLPNMLASTGFAVIRSKNPLVSNELIYLCLTENAFIEKMQQLAEQSTSTFPSIKPSDLEVCEIPCPKDDSSRNLTETLKTMFTLIATNHRENASLVELRDSLLQKLMSGEIDVSEIQL